MPPSAIRQISTCTIHARRMLAQTAPQRCELTPWDVSLLPLRYIQKGLLFHRPHSSDSQEEEPITVIIDRLKHSLSHVLAHFSPLAGRLVFENDGSSSSHVFIDCNDAGAEFIHAVADLSVAPLLSPIDVHPIVESFFPLTGAVNCDGISLPLLAVQLTELTDGFFLGCSFSHVVGDGASFWHFLNIWSEICRSNISAENGSLVNISRPPVVQRWSPSEKPYRVSLPFSRPDEFIERVSLPLLRDRFFHFTFTPQSIARLKTKANEECKTDRISSFQALSAHVWRSVVRARNLPADQSTSCRFSVDNRSRLKPPLSRDYLGNCIQGIRATTTAGELLAHDLGWAAWLVHRCVAEHSDDVARSTYDAWSREPFFYYFSRLNNCDIQIGSSPRFDVYGVDFGWGRAVAVRCGWDNKLDGKVTAFPGREGGGSIDLELCLAPEVMCALETDEEFMDTVSSDSVI